MKYKILILFLFLGAASYSLEVYRVDDLNFGEIVEGDRKVTLTNVRVYVRGEADKSVRLALDNRVATKAGIISFYAKQDVIRLTKNGRGYFVLKCELKPNSKRYGDIRDTISLNVRYE